MLKVPIMSKNVFRASNSTFHLLNVCEKNFSIWIKRKFFYNFFKDIQICRHYGAPFEPVFLGLKVSRDVCSGTRDLSRGLSY